MYENDTDYKDFLGSENMNLLTESNGERIEEELSRPKIEIWPDDDWAQWVSSHDERRRTLICNLPSMKSSPFCAMGYH
ncbi:MAG: hypothetical protein RDU20_00340 [Desulfomonilaceae bacterium]|nr:hypothetical protein [Desulfomonilaceae bacterium]